MVILDKPLQYFENFKKRQRFILGKPLSPFLKRWLLILFIIVFTLPCYSDMAFSPLLEAGSEFNNNIDQVPTDSIYDTTTGLTAGLTLEGYGNPDTFLSAGFYTSNQQFANGAYGMTREDNLKLIFENDLTERLNLGLESERVNYVDTVLEENNHLATAVMPKLFLRITPYTGVGITQRNMLIDYASTTEKAWEQKDTVFLSQQLTGWASLTVGSYTGHGSSSISSANFTTQGNNAGLFFYFSDVDKCQINYSAETNRYPDWYVDRIDQKTTATFDYRRIFLKDWSLNFSYTAIQNESKDDSQDFKNNIAAVSLAWEPTMGNIYGGEAENELEYYYNEGLKAIDKDDWRRAEKQFKKVAFLAEELAEAHFYLGYAWHKQKKYRQSAGAFEKVIMLDPAYTEAYYLLAHAYLKTGRFAEARKILQKLMEITNDPKVEEVLREIQ